MAGHNDKQHNSHLDRFVFRNLVHRVSVRPLYTPLANSRAAVPSMALSSGAHDETALKERAVPVRSFSRIQAGLEGLPTRLGRRLGAAGPQALG